MVVFDKLVADGEYQLFILSDKLAKFPLRHAKVFTCFLCKIESKCLIKASAVRPVLRSLTLIKRQERAPHFKNREKIQNEEEYRNDVAFQRI